MPIKMLRIDDRLIHGQIVTAWAKNIQAEKSGLLTMELQKMILSKELCTWLLLVTENS